MTYGQFLIIFGMVASFFINRHMKNLFSQFKEECELASDKG